MIKRIVLTGGPCAGKTTALAKIEQDLTEKGYKVFIVSETATELIKSGLRPFGNDAIDIVEFQKLIMLYQYKKEEIYNEALKVYDKKDNIVIIYDRGLLDNKAYVNNASFTEIINHLSNNLNYPLTEIDLLERYDLILHLITSADGAEEYYTKENNQARTESIEEAKKADRKTMQAWLNHPNLKIIDNDSNFQHKIDKVLNYIYQLLNSPLRKRKQLKYEVEIEETLLTAIKKQALTIDIEQIYLKNSNYEERIRKTTENGIINYYYTKQKKNKNGESEIILNKRLTKEEYLLLATNCQISDIITKKRYIFIKDKQFYRLDEYQDTYILEIEITEENKKINIPLGITIKKDLIKEKTKILIPNKS